MDKLYIGNVQTLEIYILRECKKGFKLIFFLNGPINNTHQPKFFLKKTLKEINLKNKTLDTPTTNYRGGIVSLYYLPLPPPPPPPL